MSGCVNRRSRSLFLPSAAFRARKLHSAVGDVRKVMTRNAVPGLFRLRRCRLAFLALDSCGFHFL
jgi:hypothetical protein